MTLADPVEDPAHDAPPVPEGDFAADTVVHREGDLWVGTISEAWKVVYAFGGMSMAMGVRAVQAELDRDDLTLLSANATFCSPVACGPVECEARVLRSGRSMAQGVAEVRNPGAPDVGVSVTAAFGSRVDTPIEFVDATFPDEAGRPDDHEGPPPREEGDPFPEINFHHQTEWRPAIGTRWWDEADRQAWRPGPARQGSWTRLLREPRLADGTIDPVALCVPADTIGGAVGQKLGPDDDVHFFTLSLEMGLQVLADTTSGWFLQHVHAPWAGDGYAVANIELWDEDRRLVAVADQRARLRRILPGDGFFD